MKFGNRLNEINTSHSRVGKGEFHPFASHRTVREALTSYGSCYAVNNSGHP